MTKKLTEVEEKLKEATEEIWNLSVQVQPAINALTDYKSLIEQLKKREEE